MAVFEIGVLGGFSGAVGPVVGSTWRTLDVLRAKPKKSGKTPVQSQIDQRQKFGLVTSFLSNAKLMIDVGYQANNKVITPMNAAVSLHLGNAITGASPSFSLDYTKVVLSQGKMVGADNTAMVPATGRLIKLSWDAADDSDANEKLIRDKDKLMVFAYNPTGQLSLTSRGKSLRGDETADIKFPSVFKGALVHVWIFFVSENGKTVSKSEYLKTTTLIE